MNDTLRTRHLRKLHENFTGYGFYGADRKTILNACQFSHSAINPGISQIRGGGFARR
ncbi:MAG: hypothetical protein JW929_01585 [Anaerolineales bacterium]|nr:hypothetical protein [Anaerolineales bacterium]